MKQQQQQQHREPTPVMMKDGVSMEKTEVKLDQVIFRRNKSWVVVTLPSVTLTSDWKPWMHVRKNCGLGLCCYEPASPADYSLDFMVDLHACLAMALEYSKEQNIKAEQEYNDSLPKRIHLSEEYDRLQAEALKAYVMDAHARVEAPKVAPPPSSITGGK
jgi:hypothetical protein